MRALVFVLALTAPTFAASDPTLSVRVEATQVGVGPVQIENAVLVPMNDVTYVCASFRNEDPKTATAVKFEVDAWDAFGARLGIFTFIRTGSFAQNVTIDGPKTATEAEVYLHSNGDQRLANCGYIAATYPGVTLLTIAPVAVKFEDGTTWQLPPKSNP